MLEFRQNRWWIIALEIITILAFLIGVYSLIKSDSPNLNYIVQADFSIFSTQDTVNDFALEYKGERMLVSNHILKAVKLKISNDGGKDISINDYDTSIPFGLKLNNAQFVGPIILSRTSNTYLKENIMLNKLSSHEIYINNIQIEQGQYFELEFIIMYWRDIVPDIIPTGKILGMVNPSIVEVDIMKGTDRRRYIPYRQYLENKYN